MRTSLPDLSDRQLCPDFKFMDTQSVEMGFLWGLLCPNVSLTHALMR